MRWKRLFRLVVALLLAVIVIAVLAWWKKHDFRDEIKREDNEQNLLLSAWIVDWQWQEGVADFEQLAFVLDKVQMFAAYFDSQDRLYFTDEAHQALPRIFQMAKVQQVDRVDLTLVNDRWNDDGTVVQKDGQMLSRLLGTPERRSAHIDEIMQVVSKYGFDGVEVDYENINEADWSHVCLFYEELYERLHSEGKLLRVILEPKAAISHVSWPEGPEYVMMAYNLFGSHSGPGPKADISFIQELVYRMKQLPGKPGIALATGGFDWPSGGKVKAVSEKEAVETAQKAGVVPERDTASGSLHYMYIDETGTQHTVWYADGVTLLQWMDAARQAGCHDISFWRLGEWEQVSLERVAERFAALGKEEHGPK